MWTGTGGHCWDSIEDVFLTPDSLYLPLLRFLIIFTFEFVLYK